MSTFVVDASVLFKTLVSEPDSDHADALVASSHVVVPEILYAEIANAIWARRRRRGLNDVTAQGLITDVLRAAFEVHSNRPHMARAFALATAIDHPVYDCIYLALAEHLHIPLITADRRFIAAVGKNHVARSPVIALGDPA